MKNLYYFHSILEIGGIETFFYYLAKKYKDWDLVIVYQIGNEKQLDRLKPYVKCIQYKPGMKFECERAFFNFNTDIIDSVTATKGYYLVVHGDYKDMVERKQLSLTHMPGHGKITNYIGVSQKACDSFKEVTGHECQLCYNPFMPDKPEKTYHLISATRLSTEKGGNRMVALAERLTQRGIKYDWAVYSNRTIQKKLPAGMHIEKPTLQIQDHIIDADFLVQLSDNEGYCYSVVEAWYNKIPVIMTPLPVLKEIGANENNSIILDFDLKNLDEVIDTMISKDFNFTYTPKEDNWDQILIPGHSIYQEELNAMYLVKALDTYENENIVDSVLGRIPKRNETWIVDKERFDILSGKNKRGLVFVSLVEKIPKEKFNNKNSI